MRTRKILVIIFLCFLCISCSQQTDEQHVKANKLAQKQSQANPSLSEDFNLKLDVKQRRDRSFLFTVKLTNNSPKDIELTFPSLQQYDLILKDKHDHIVYQSSAEKVYAEVLKKVTIHSKDTITYTETWDGLTNGKPVPTGTYQLTGIIPAIKTDALELGEGALKKTIKIEIK